MLERFSILLIGRSKLPWTRCNASAGMDTLMASGADGSIVARLFINSFPTCTLSDYPTGRILRDARLYCVGAGTQEIRRMLIGREFNMELSG